MRRIAIALLAGAGILGLSSMASAADLGARKAPPPPPPVWSWTGFYIGAHLGAGWSTAEWDLIDIRFDGVPQLVPGTVIPFSSHDANGFLGGIQGGFNWQLGFVVFGFEAQGSWTGIDGEGPCTLDSGLELDIDGVYACRSKTDFLLTAAGRLGVAIDRALVYLKGGVAWATREHTAVLRLGDEFRLAGPVEVDRFGVVLGIGAEYAFTPNWSAKIEYNFVDFQDERVSFPIHIDTVFTGFHADVDVRQSLHLVKFGVNYRFSLFGPPAPVAARY